MNDKAIVLLEASLKTQDFKLVEMAIEELRDNVIPIREPNTAPKRKAKGQT